jgi:hypothetical protein
MRYLIILATLSLFGCKSEPKKGLFSVTLEKTYFHGALYKDSVTLPLNTEKEISKTINVDEQIVCIARSLGKPHNYINLKCNIKGDSIMINIFSMCTLDKIEDYGNIKNSFLHFDDLTLYTSVSCI